MEQKLAEFRARRRREELVERTKHAVYSVLTMNLGRGTESAQEESRLPLLPPEEFPPPYSSCSPTPEESPESDVTPPHEEEEEDESPRAAWLRRGQLGLLTVLWVTLLAASMQLGLTLAYLMLSLLLGLVFLGTSTRPRTPGAPSAYSVFNPNCESIEGTLTAEQFEREIRYGPASVR